MYKRQEARYGGKNVAELLISHGIGVNAKGNDNNTALLYASNSGNNEMAAILLSHGANAPLHFASKSGDKEMVAVLLSHGANANEKDILGNTAIHYAISSNDKKWLNSFCLTEQMSVQKVYLEIRQFSWQGKRNIWKL